MPRYSTQRAPVPDRGHSDTRCRAVARSRAAAVLTLLLGCPAAAIGEIRVAPGKAGGQPPPRTETVVHGLERPWSLAVLPGGGLLVTERPGRLRVVTPDGELWPDPVQGLPEVDAREHGGLLDVALDPGFATNRRFYFSYTEPGTDDEAGRNALVVARATLTADARRARKVRTLFRQQPKVESPENLGGRLAVSDDGHLFVTVGDRRVAEERARAQDLSAAHGKTLRIRTDGSVPEDNPFVGVPGALPEIWSLGHRNPQGAFVHPASGELWIAEHGPQGGDEINIARRGLNYGWPLVSFGCEYDTCDAIGAGGEAPGMEPPLAYWTLPSAAPSNLLVYDGPEFPDWRGDLLVGGLSSRAVWRLALAGTPEEPEVVGREPMFTELDERIRDIRQSPEGRLYLLTDGADARVIRVHR